MSDWPKTVPILTAKDMCVVEFKNGECGCLVNWNMQAFVDLHADDATRVSSALIESHKQLRTGVPERHVKQCGQEAYYTDTDVRCGKSVLSRVWNRAMAILGYVVNNPECTQSGKLRPAS